MIPVQPPTMSQKLRTLLLDLDGTLVDTAPDLALALNLLREEKGLPPLPFKRIRPEVSHGGGALIRLAFARHPGHMEFEALRQRFLALYQQNLTTHTRLFPGMNRLLDTLEQHGIPWGVVTNKPGWLTEPLMRRLELDQRAGCIVSGDTLEQSKPHPAPLLHACHLIGSAPHQSLYVGDAQRDIEAGHAAGMKTLVATFGYIGERDNPERWGADGLVSEPLEILSCLGLPSTGKDRCQQTLTR